MSGATDSALSSANIVLTLHGLSVIIDAIKESRQIFHHIITTLIVVYGIILPPIGWKLALFVWGYALSWFIFNDFVKLGA